MIYILVPNFVALCYTNFFKIDNNVYDRYFQLLSYILNEYISANK